MTEDKPCGARLLAMACVAGASMMSLELCALRMLAPSFGGGTYVWGALIGVVMAALSGGYYLGGRLADKSSDAKPACRLMAVAGAMTAILAGIGRPAIMSMTFAGFFWGPILASLVLFAPPIMALSMVAPAAIRFIVKSTPEVGSVSGRVYAVSTVGSIAGTLATAFILLPAIGTKATVLCNAVALFLTGYLNSPDRDNALLAVLLAGGVVLAYTGDAQLDRAYGNVIHASESEYNIIRVYDTPTMRRLVLNDEGLTQTVMLKGSTLTGRYYDLYTAGPLINGGGRVLFIGLAGGTAVKQLLEFHEVEVDAVEIDPKVVEVAGDYFGLAERPGLNVFVDDGRQFLRGAGTYDLICQDTYSGGGYLPAHLSSLEFFAEAREHLSENGIFMINVVTYGDDTGLGYAVANTLKGAYPSVFTVMSGGNMIVLGFKRRTSEAEILERIRSNRNPLLGNVTLAYETTLREYTASGGTVFTDDRSNVEELAYAARMRAR